MIKCMNVDEAGGICKDRSRWRSVSFAYPHGKKSVIYVCKVLIFINNVYIGPTLNSHSLLSQHSFFFCRICGCIHKHYLLTDKIARPGTNAVAGSVKAVIKSTIHSTLADCSVTATNLPVNYLLHKHFYKILQET